MRIVKGAVLVISSIYMAFAQEETPWQGPSVDFKHGKLIISENKRFLMFEDKTPFFILGIQAGNYFIASTNKKQKCILRIDEQRDLL